MGIFIKYICCSDLLYGKNGVGPGVGLFFGAPGTEFHPISV